MSKLPPCTVPIQWDVIRWNHAFCLTGPLSGESTGHRWCYLQKSRQCGTLTYVLLLAWTSCWTNISFLWFEASMCSYDVIDKMAQTLNTISNCLGIKWFVCLQLKYIARFIVCQNSVLILILTFLFGSMVTVCHTSCDTSVNSLYKESVRWRFHGDIIKWKHFRVAGHLSGEFTIYKVSETKS